MSSWPSFRTELSLYPFNPGITQQFTYINKSMQDKLRHRLITDLRKPKPVSAAQPRSLSHPCTSFPKTVSLHCCSDSLPSPGAFRLAPRFLLGRDNQSGTTARWENYYTSPWREADLEALVWLQLQVVPGAGFRTLSCSTLTTVTPCR